MTPPPAGRTVPAIDAIVVGGGPNGLAAAITLARAGHSVRLYEAASTVGGGSRTAALTLPGFLHDVCSTAHPLALASPFFRSFDFGAHGVEWAHAPAPLAHALAPGRSVLLERDVDATADGLGRAGAGWRRVFRPLVRGWEALVPELLRPVIHVPRHPVGLAGFGLRALPSAGVLARLALPDPGAAALFTGMSAHAMVRLDRPLTASFGLVLGMLAHAVGWPVAVGGSGRIAAAMEAEARRLGVEIETDHPVATLDELPPARTYLLDVTPRQVLAMAGDRLPAGYRRQLAGFRYGPGVFKLDWALSGPIPWADPATARAGTVHLGGTARDVIRAEGEVARGRHPEQPYVLLVQPTIADATRAPEGRHTAWAYCHVPNGSTVDMTDVIERRVETFAPGFRDLILARSARGSRDVEAYDANYIGGDINGGIQDWRQLIFRPVVRLNPYTTPDPSIFLCSSSTPPGGGVHGMSGLQAAQAAIHRLRTRG